MSVLRISTCQARNTFPLMEKLAPYLTQRLRESVSFENSISWLDRYRFLERGELDVGWICAKPYALDLKEPVRRYSGLVIPVMKGDLYAGQPVYYSYLATHRAHPATSIHDLKGGRVAYNEEGSQSGYFSLLDALDRINQPPEYFGQWLRSGAHFQSIYLLKAHIADVAAIDATVWDYEVEKDPTCFDDLKILGTLGPYPGPPLAANFHLPINLQQGLIRVLSEMHLDPEGREILDESLIDCFVPCEDDLYLSLVP
ncbi:MAG: PhnD/SsuA/transferrin family substrate-binding protein [Chloroflexota bacterium]